MLSNVWNGRESSTVHKYCLYLRKFLSFLREKDYSSNLPFSSTSVAEYLASLISQNASKSTLNAVMAALKWIHSFVPGINQFNNPMNDDFLSKMISSSKRRVGLVKNQKKPLLGIHIQQIFASSNMDCPIELRNCLIIGLAFCLLLRHDEVSHMTMEHFTECLGGRKIFIPKSKTDEF